MDKDRLKQFERITRILDDCNQAYDLKNDLLVFKSKYIKEGTEESKLLDKTIQLVMDIGQKKESAFRGIF